MPLNSTPTFLDFNKDADRISQIVSGVIDGKIGRGRFSRTRVLDDIEDARNVVIAVLLKYDNDSINKFVNDKRVERGLEPLEKRIDRRDIYEFRKAYGDIIDEAYIHVSTYIGDAFPFADKLKRIASMNNLIELLEPQIKQELSGYPDELTLKKGNMFIKLLQNINAEMGDKTMADFLVPREKILKARSEENEEVTLSAKDIEKALEARYQSQMPDAVSTSVKYTDYRNCAMGERFSDEMVICWNEKIMKQFDGKPGHQCAIQCGKLKKCPKFLNASLLDDPAWCERIRADVKLTWVEVAKVLGADDLDADVRDRIAYYFNKHGITQRVSFNDSSIYLRDGNTGHSIHEQTGDGRTTDADDESAEDSGQTDREGGS